MGNPLYAMIAVALLTHRDTLRHGPAAAQVAALDALLHLLTLARTEALRQGRLTDPRPMQRQEVTR